MATLSPSSPRASFFALQLPTGVHLWPYVLGGILGLVAAMLAATLALSVIVGLILVFIFHNGVSYLLGQGRQSPPLLAEKASEAPMQARLDKEYPQRQAAVEAHLLSHDQLTLADNVAMMYHNRAVELHQLTLTLFREWDAHVNSLALASPTEEDAALFLEDFKWKVEGCRLHENYELLTDHFPPSRETASTQ